MHLAQFLITQEVLQRVGGPLDLIERGPGDLPAGANDGIAGADQSSWIRIHRACTVLELADEAVVHAAKFRLLGLAQVEIRKEAPQRNRDIAHSRLFDLAEPAHEPRE